MYNYFKTTVAVCAIALTAGAAQAGTFSFDLIGLTDNGVGNNFVGQTVGEGTVTWEDADVTADPNVELVAVATLPPFPIPGFVGDPEFSFSVTAFGQTFGDSDDPDALLKFQSGNISNFSLSMTSDNSDAGGIVTSFTDPRILGFSTFTGGTNSGSFIAALNSPNGNTFGINVAINDVAAPVNPIPLPASSLLLLSGLVGAGAVMRRRKRA